MEKSLKDECTDYGRWEREGHPSGFYRIGTLGRIKDEGAGASASCGIRDFVPIRDCPARLQRIREAVMQRMDDRERAVFRYRFCFKGSPEQKARALGMSRRTFYVVLDAALSKI